MAVQTARPSVPPDVFVSFIVDSGTPGWEDICVKYVSIIISRIQKTNQNTPRFRFSHVLYSSADSHKSPIIKNTYFNRVEDSEPAFMAIRQPLQISIARTVPGGGSAALEGLVRAIEHLDFLESSEPGSKECAKHIIFVTASPPDESKRPLHNISAEFDNFGWSQCEEWLKQHSIRMTLLITRLPAHPLYLSLNNAVNPSGPLPMPEGGPLRVYLSSVLMMPQNPNTSTAVHTSSPVGAGGSPGTNAASPNRKRKATEDAQISPRRPKFPPGTVGTNPPVTGTPPIAAATPVPPAIGTTPRPISVNGMRPPPAAGPSIKTEPPSVPPAVNPHTGSGPTRTMPPSQPAMQPPVAGVRPSSAPGVAIPPPVAPPASSITAPPSLTNLQGYISKFLSDSPAAQREALIKLTKLRDDQQQLIYKLKQEGKQIEANERFAQHRKLTEMMAMLGQELQKQQGQRMRDQAAAAATSGPTQPSNPVNPPRVNMDNTAFASQPANVALPNPAIPTQSNPSTINIPNMGGNNSNSAGPLNSVPVASTAQPEQATAGPSWRGIMCIVTNNDKTRVNADLLVSLTPMRASTAEQAALKNWPPRLFVQIARSQTPSDQFIQWLRSHQPEGVFVVRLGVDPNSIPAQSMATNPQLQAAITRFTSLQNSIVTNKLVLKGSITLSTGETNHIILFHMPTPVAAGNNAQIALARFSREPNSMTLPGIVPGAPAAGSNNGSGTLPNSSMARIGIGMTNNPPNALSVPSAMGSNMGIASGVSGSLATTGVASTGGPSSGLTAQQVANMLNNAGAGNLNSLQNNPGLNALMSNPQVFSQLQRLRQQQQLGSGVGNPSSMGMPGMGSAPNTTNHGMSATGLSGANLLDRLGTNSLGHSGSISGPSAGSNTFGSVPGGSSLQQQQVMAALSAHSATMGGAAANLSNNNNNMFGTAFSNFGINNPSTTSVGTMGNMNFNSNQPQLGLNMGLNNGGIGAGMGANMGASNNFGMANAAGAAGRGLTPAHLNEIRRRASIMAASTGISEQEALARVFRSLTGGSG